jgi:Zn-dependent protease with chaperone function
VLLAGLSPSPLGAAPPSYLDRRVTALSPAALLSRPPAQLIDPRRQRVSARMRRYSRPLFFIWALSQIVLFFYLWASGRAAKLRDAVRQRIRPVLPMRFAYGTLLAALGGLAALPASLARYRVEVAFGITNEPVLGWIRDGLIATTADALLVGFIVAFVFALVDRSRLWWIYAMFGLFVLTLMMAFLEPVVIAPLYNRFSPLPASASVRAPLLALARRAGIGDAPIFVSDDSRRTSAAIADVAGFGPTKRIVLSDALLQNATTGEILFLAAREFGHYAHTDDFRLSLFWTSLFIFCTALAVVAADRVGFRRDDDPLARLTLVLGFLGTFALVATPVYNGYSRNLESRADAYALTLTGDRVSAVRAYVRIVDETLAPLCPSRPALWYFYNSPPLGTRIAKAAGRPDPCR